MSGCMVIKGGGTKPLSTVGGEKKNKKNQRSVSKYQTMENEKYDTLGEGKVEKR